MIVLLTLNSTSFVKIGLGIKLLVGAYYGYIRALVDSIAAYPGEIKIWGGAGEEYYFSLDFYLPNVTEGTHTIEIQWRTSTSLYGIYAEERALIVTALSIQ